MSDNLFFIPALTISGNLITIFSILGYVCNLFFLTPNINSLVTMVTDTKPIKDISRRKKKEREAIKISKKKSRAQVKRKQTPWQAIEVKEIEREAIKIRVQKSRAQAKRKQTSEQTINEKAVEREAIKIREQK